MAKMVAVFEWLALNPEHVASVRRNDGGSGVTIEMINGTRHNAIRASVATVIAKLNGDPDA